MIAAYRDSYDEADRAAGLALFDRGYRQAALAGLKQSLADQSLPAAGRTGLAAVAC